MQMLAMQSTCGCGTVATRHWLQFVSVLTFLLAGGINMFITGFVLPRILAESEPSFLIRAWVGTSEILAVYGWIIIAVALLTWAFWPHYGYTPEMPVRVAQGLLILALLLGLAQVIFPLIPVEGLAGINSFISNYSGLLSTANWALVVLALGGICYSAETRDFLMGDGKILSLIALGFLLLVVVLAGIGWGTLGAASETPASGQETAAPAAAPPAETQPQQ